MFGMNYYKKKKNLFSYIQITIIFKAEGHVLVNELSLS